jgi:hypothetical protein
MMIREASATAREAETDQVASQKRKNCRGKKIPWKEEHREGGHGTRRLRIARQAQPSEISDKVYIRVEQSTAILL